jgi:uncharacterized protein YqjF (DUF2071 family)
MDGFAPAAAVPVRRPVMRQEWSGVTFLHWSYPVPVLQELLPRGLSVQRYADRAWASLVLLRMRVRGPLGPGGPGLASVTAFPETNVRTYVVGPDGEAGIYFFSLDAGALPAVLAARGGWGLPYFWARMRIEKEAGSIRYRSSRRMPGPAGSGHDITVSPGGSIEQDERDRFLTARFVLWHEHAGALLRTRADHEPWQLRSVEVRSCREDLLSAAGLPAAEGRPLAHYGERVRVRIGVPRPVSRGGSPAAAPSRGSAPG